MLTCTEQWGWRCWCQQSDRDRSSWGTNCPRRSCEAVQINNRVTLEMMSCMATSSIGSRSTIWHVGLDMRRCFKMDSMPGLSDGLCLLAGQLPLACTSCRQSETRSMAMCCCTTCNQRFMKKGPPAHLLRCLLQPVQGSSRQAERAYTPVCREQDGQAGPGPPELLV